MPRLMVALLTVAVLASAVGVVYVRNQSRVRFVQLQGLQAERDRLNVEWGRLLLEEGTWAAHGRVEKVARQRLDMAMPTPDAIVTVRVEKQR